MSMPVSVLSARNTRRLTLLDGNFVSRALPCLYSHQLHQTISSVPFAWFSAFGREIIQPKSDRPIFSRQVNLFCRHAAFCEAGYEAKVTFLNNNNNNNNNQYIYKQRQSHAMSQRRWLATAVIFRPSDMSLGFAET